MGIRLLIPIFCLMLLSGCAHIHKKGTKEVKVLHSVTENPLVNVGLVYQYVKKPYFIVGRMVESRPYYSNENGLALVPELAIITIASDSEWELDQEKMEKEFPFTDRPDVYYAKKK